MYRKIPSALFLTLILTTIASALDYKTTWIANTFGGADNEFVQMDSRCLYVTPDGTCFLNVVWEEGGHNAALYRNGRYIDNPGRTHGWGSNGGVTVIANDKYIFIAQSRDSEGGHLHEKDPESYPPGDTKWFGLTRRTRSSNGREAAPFATGRGSGEEIRGLGSDKQAALSRAFLVVNEVPTKPKGLNGHIRGLALDSTGRLYISNPFQSQILVYDSETMEKLALWQVEDARQLAVAPDDTLWAVVGQTDLRGRLPEGAPRPRIVHYSADGNRLPGEVTSVAVPTGLAFDPQGNLLVSDNGPDQQIKLFDVSGAAPKQIGTFGKKGGIYNGQRGKVAPLKFHGLQGVGSDSEGNIYVCCNGWGGNGSGLTLESYEPNGDRNWVLYGLEFVDNGDFDRSTDGADIYTTFEHFTMDYTRPTGQQWTYVGYTLDRFRYPDDPRLHTGFTTAFFRTVNGQKLMYMTNMYSSFFAVFRFEQGSELAVPCGFFWKGRKPQKGEFWKKPELTPNRFIWIDANGDGMMDDAEFEVDDEAEPPLWAWWVDSNGDIWQGYQGKRQIARFPLLNFTDKGVPQYSRAQAVIEDAPAPFGGKGRGRAIERVQYYPEEDVMYIAGYTTEYPNPGGWWKGTGRVAVRYDNWLGRAGERRMAYQLPISSRRKQEGIASMDAAGDLFFTIQSRTALVAVYDAATGAKLATMEPGPEVGGRIGWIDVPYGMFAHQRQDGEYLLLCEDDWRAKNIIYRFRVPKVDKPSIPTGLKAEAEEAHINLVWQAAPRAQSYVVERTVGDEPFKRLGCAEKAAGYRDEAVTPGLTYTYRVTAVGWGGSSEASAEASAEAAGASSAFFESFEGASSSIPRITPVKMPAPELEGGGRYAGKLSHVNIFHGFDIPEGAQKLIIRYDRLYLKSPEGHCREHFTRQFVGFNNKGGDRVGQGTRYYLNGEDVGKWTEVRLEIPIPEVSTRVRGGEITNGIGQPEEDYDNPVYIDNFRITFE